MIFTTNTFTVGNIKSNLIHADGKISDPIKLPCDTPLIIIVFKTTAAACPSTRTMSYRAVPNTGTASEVDGIFSATRFRNTVSDNKIVTPANRPT